MIKLKNLLKETADFEVYNPSYSSALDQARKFAERRGYTIDEDDWWGRISTGPRKPSAGKTNRFSITLYKNGKEQRKALNIQVYGMDSGKYELNAYIN